MKPLELNCNYGWNSMKGVTGSLGDQLLLFHCATVAGKGLPLQLEEGDFSLRATLEGSKGSI